MKSNPSGHRKPKRNPGLNRVKNQLRCLLDVSNVVGYSGYCTCVSYSFFINLLKLLPPPQALARWLSAVLQDRTRWRFRKARSGCGGGS